MNSATLFQKVNELVESNDASALQVLAEFVYMERLRSLELQVQLNNYIIRDEEEVLRRAQIRVLKNGGTLLKGIHYK